MSNARIVERTQTNGVKVYVIQQRHFLFRWWWVDAWLNALDGASCVDTFTTLEQALKCFPDFEGTNQCKDRVVYPPPRPAL